MIYKKKRRRQASTIAMICLLKRTKKNLSVQHPLFIYTRNNNGTGMVRHVDPLTGTGNGRNRTKKKERKKTPFLKPELFFFIHDEARETVHGRRRIHE